MGQRIDSITDFRQYLQLVEERAQHHAQNVDTIILALAGAVVMLSDNNTLLEVRTYGGNTANVLWLKRGGQRYAFSYNHVDNTIELRQSSVRGVTVASFSNRSTLRQVRDAISRL